MSKFQHDVMLRIVKILNVLMIELPFAACWFLYYSHQTYANLAWEGHFAILGLFLVLYIALGKVYDAFWMSMQRVSELVYGQILGAMATDGILYIVICLMSAKLCNLLPGIAAIVGQLVMAAIWASCAHKWYYATFPPQKTAVVYDVRHGMEKLINEYLENQGGNAMRLNDNTTFIGINPPYQLSVIHSSKLIYPREIYQLGEEIYCEALRHIVEAWEGRPDSFRAAVLRGVMYFVQLYHGQYSEERLVRALSGVHPMELYRISRDNPAKLPGWRRYVYPIYTTYNGKCRKDALPMKF